MKHRILVIEPNETHRRSLAGILSSRGFAAETVDSGREGVQCLDKYPPAVLVTALFMDEVDGLEVTQLSRSLSPDTRLIVIDRNPPTSTRMADYLDVARQIGADVCLRNPSLTQVADAVEELLAQSRQNVAEQK